MPRNAPTLAAEPEQRETAWPLLILVVLLLSAPMILLSQIAAHWRFDVVDDQMFGYFGWRIASGARVYLDVWDNKPPGIYWMNALGFLLGAGTYAGVVALCAAALVASHVLFFLTCASLFFRGAAALATILLSFFLTNIFYQGGTNRTETFLVVFELAGVLTYVRAFAHDRWWRWLLAGAFCGAAFLFKQVGLAAWGAMGLHLLILAVTRDIRWRDALLRGLLLAGGVACVCAAAAAYLAWQGALRDALFATFTFNAAYFAVGDSSFFDTWLNRHMLKNHLLPRLRLPVLMAIAACIHATVWRLKPLFRPPEIERPLREFGPTCPRYMLFFALWTLIALYGASVSPHHFRHYLIPCIAPLMFLAAYLVNVLKTEISLTRRLAQRGWVVACFVAMGYFAWDAARLQWEDAARVWFERWGSARPGPDGVARPNLSPWEKIGAEVALRTTPDQTIYCWGYWPGVYLYAQRVAACRFITTEKIGHVRDYADFVRRDIHAALRDHPPAVIVVGISDYTWFTDPQDFQPPRDWIGEWMSGWLDSNYVRVMEITTYEAVFIYQRRDLVGQPVSDRQPAGRGASAAKRGASTEKMPLRLEERVRRRVDPPVAQRVVQRVERGDGVGRGAVQGARVDETHARQRLVECFVRVPEQHMGRDARGRFEVGGGFRQRRDAGKTRLVAMEDGNARVVQENARRDGFRRS